jgi:hypothetical protein
MYHSRSLGDRAGDYWYNVVRPKAISVSETLFSPSDQPLRKKDVLLYIAAGLALVCLAHSPGCPPERPSVNDHHPAQLEKIINNYQLSDYRPLR